MTMTNETEREAFEAWYVEFFAEPLPEWFQIVHMWECWKAARASMPSQPHGDFDVEAMLVACVPGGSSCDPQRAADAIREYCASLPSQPQGEPVAYRIVRNLGNGGRMTEFEAYTPWPYLDNALSCEPLYLATHPHPTERSAELEAVQRDAWRPIESAPKDGTDILGMYMHIETQVVHSVFWMPHDDFSDNPEGWWSYTDSEVSRTLLDGWQTPTHWMPLPPSPIAAAPQKGDK